MAYSEALQYPAGVADGEPWQAALRLMGKSEEQESVNGEAEELSDP